MASRTPQVGLVMIVRNEEAVIERALRSARPFISTWVIVDTGSTDTTKEIVMRVMGDMPGVLESRPWVDFGHNRTEAMELCEGRMDWAIMLDADDTLEGVVPPAHIWSIPNIDGMLMTLHHDQMRHERVQVFRVAAGWCYTGAVHEVAMLKSGAPANVARLSSEIYMITRCEGARSRDPDKYKKDAAVLLGIWEKEGEKDHRTLFYLAQSYRDAQMNTDAIQRYKEYLDISGATDQEKYLSIVSLLTLVDDPAERTALVWAAIELVPTRLEAPYIYINRWRMEGRKMGIQQFAIATAIKGRKPADSDVYTNQLVYDWGLDNELMGVAAEVGRWSVVRDSAIRCATNMPDSTMREAAIQRIRLANEKLLEK
jgi:glycosyltransferase involved in cell wall biosynthesis